MAPRGLAQKGNKKDKKKVGFSEEHKSKVYATKVPVSIATLEKPIEFQNRRRNFVMNRQRNGSISF